MFVSILFEKCSEQGINVIDIFTNYITEDYRTIRKYLFDGVHPSTLVLSHIFNELNHKLNISINIPFKWRIREFLRHIKKFIK